MFPRSKILTEGLENFLSYSGSKTNGQPNHTKVSSKKVFLAHPKLQFLSHVWSLIHPFETVSISLLPMLLAPQNEVCHEKTDLKVFVVAPILLLVWHRLLENMIYAWSQKTQILKSRCHTKRRMAAATGAHPSFGMTTTKTLRSVFSWRASDVKAPQEE